MNIMKIESLIYSIISFWSTYNEFPLLTETRKVLPMELLEKISGYLPIDDRLKLACSCRTFYDNWLKKENKKIFCIEDPYLYMESLVFYGKQSNKKYLDFLIQYENTENRQIREKILNLYKDVDDRDEQDIEHTEVIKKIIHICNNTNMIVNHYCKQPALYRAIQYNDLEGVKLLLSHFDGDPHRKALRHIHDHGEYSGLLCAVIHKSSDIVKAILDEKNTYHLDSKDLNDALWKAFDSIGPSSKLGITEMLLQHPLCNPNLIIHDAAKYPEMIQSIVKYAHQRIDFTRRNHDGKTVIDIINQYISKPGTYLHYWEHRSQKEREENLQLVLDYQKNNPTPVLSFFYNILLYILQMIKNIIPINL